MTSRTFSLTNFSGEPNEEKLALCFIVRGEPTALLGESGGVLAAGKREGNGLIPEAFVEVEFPDAPKLVPVFASSINDFTLGNMKYKSFRLRLVATQKLARRKLGEILNINCYLIWVHISI